MASHTRPPYGEIRTSRFLFCYSLLGVGIDDLSRGSGAGLKKKQQQQNLALGLVHEVMKAILSFPVSYLIAYSKKS